MKSILACFLLLSATAAGQPPAYTGPAWYRYPATPSEMAAAEAVVKTNLKDEDSAKFRGLYKLSRGMGDDIVCGEVNSKNSYGGYTGFTGFYVHADGASRFASEQPLGALVGDVCNKPAPPSAQEPKQSE